MKKAEKIGENNLMSVSLILQDENKKTLGGYLWIFLTLSTVITLHIGNYDFSEINSMMSFITVYILLASFLSLAFITIRPENYLNKYLFSDKRIPPYFTSNDNLSLVEMISSPLISKERDNFWGNFLIGIGFSVALFLPLDKVIESGLILIFDIAKILITSLFSILILSNWYFKQKKDLRTKLEIVWRYMELLSQMGWREHYTEQIKALEDSLKLQLWKKAEYQINEFNQAYRNDLEHILEHSVDFRRSYLFLLGRIQFKSTFLKFNFDDLKKFYTRARILGMEYHDLEMFSTLKVRINEFQHLKGDFNERSGKLSDRYGYVRDIIDKSETIIKKDHFQRLFSQLDYNLYHIEPTVENFAEFEKVKNFASQSKEDEIIKWFEGVNDTTEFYKKFTDDFRNVFNKKVELRLSKLGENPADVIDDSIKDIGLWIVNFLNNY